MYDNQILHAHGKVKKEDLDRIEQKFHVKIPAEVREHYLTYNGSYLAKSLTAFINSLTEDEDDGEDLDDE